MIMNEKNEMTEENFLEEIKRECENDEEFK